MNMHTNTGLLRLLQLCSANFPVGAYAFSQGLEWAVEAGWITHEAQFKLWLDDQLNNAMALLDVPILLRCLESLNADTAGFQKTSARTQVLQGKVLHNYPRHDDTSLEHWNTFLLANRETKEFRTAELAMGEAGVRVAKELNIPLPHLETPPCFLLVFACLAYHWRIDTESACLGYLWSWLENQVAAGIKLIPLGQNQAQRLLAHHINQLPDVLKTAFQVADEEIGASLSGLAIASARHETQYSRLFRS